MAWAIDNYYFCSARDSNQFTVSVNIEAHGKVTFNLTYEQLLSRNLDVYSNVININPQQVSTELTSSQYQLT